MILSTLRSDSAHPPRPHRPIRARLGSAALLLVGFAALLWAAVHTRSGQQLDAELMSIITLRLGSLGSGTRHTLELAPAALPVLAVAATGIAWLANARALGFQTALRTGALGVAIVIVSSLLSVVLRDTLLRPALASSGVRENTFPSWQVAILVALGATTILLAPGRRWPWALGFATMLLLQALAVIAQQSQRPSDVVGALLLATAVALILTCSPLPMSARPARGGAQGGEFDVVTWKPGQNPPLTLPNRHQDPDVWAGAR